MCKRQYFWFYALAQCVFRGVGEREGGKMCLWNSILYVYKCINTQSKKGHYYRIQIHKSRHTRIFRSSTYTIEYENTRKSISLTWLSFHFVSLRPILSQALSSSTFSFLLCFPRSTSLLVCFFARHTFVLLISIFIYISIYLLTAQTIFDCSILVRRFSACLVVCFWSVLQSLHIYIFIYVHLSMNMCVTPHICSSDSLATADRLESGCALKITFYVSQVS